MRACPAPNSSARLASGANPAILSGTGTGTVSAADAPSFINSSVAGPSLTAYTASGGPVSIQTRWAKVQNADDGTAGTNDVWNLFYANKSTVSSTATVLDECRHGLRVQRQRPADLARRDRRSPSRRSPSTGSISATSSSSYGSGGLTEYTTSGGTVTTNTLPQDGYASGTLNNLSITDGRQGLGHLQQRQHLALANIGVVQFNNSDGLKADSNGNYEQTLDSGTALVGLNGTDDRRRQCRAIEYRHCGRIF